MKVKAGASMEFKEEFEETMKEMEQVDWFWTKEK